MTPWDLAAATGNNSLHGQKMNTKTGLRKYIREKKSEVKTTEIIDNFSMLGM